MAPSSRFGAQAAVGVGFLLALLWVTPACADAPVIVVDEDRRVSARVRSLSLQAVLQAFSDATGVEIRVSGRADESVSVGFEGLPTYDALKTILAGRSSIGFYATDGAGAEDASLRLAKVWVLNGAGRSGPNPPRRMRQARSQRSRPVDPVKLQAPPAVDEPEEGPVLMARQRRSELPPLSPSVVIYTSRGCGSCKQAIAYLESKGVAYVQKNITTDPEARKEFRAKGGRGVPLIEVGGKSMRGFNAPRLDQLLARQG